MRDSIVFYRSFYDAVKDFSPEDFKKAVSAILDYGLDGIEPESSGIEKTIFILTKPQIDANNRRRENGSKGGRPVTTGEPNNNLDITEEKPNNNQTVTKPEPNVNVNVNDNVNVNANESKRSTNFVPPTRQQVAEYIAEKGYSNVDVERFIDFYSSKGWMVGKNKMKDWKAAVRNWARSESATKPKATANKFNNFNQRSYDFDQLEKQALGAQKG